MGNSVSWRGLEIYFYAICVTLGVGLGYLVARERAKIYDLAKEVVDSAFLWMFFPAVIGARLYHVASDWNYYRISLGEILAVRNGGWGIIGALMGGLLGLAVFAGRRKIKLLKLTDLLVPSIALAQAVGRWGNWFNQEAYGWPTKLPWGMFVSAGRRLPGYEEFAYFHPWMVYESTLNLVNFGVLVWVVKKLRNRKTEKQGVINPVPAKGHCLSEAERSRESEPVVAPRFSTSSNNNKEGGAFG